MRNAYAIQTVNKVIAAQSIGNVGIPMGLHGPLQCC